MLTTISKNNENGHVAVFMDELMEQLGEALKIVVTHEVYYDILRSSIKRTTVFVRRTCRDLMVNTYNKWIISRHRANMDIQLVVDAYAAAAYVASYLTKSNAVMSATLRNAQKQNYDGNKNIRKKLLSIANVFHNSVEVSAQECIYTLLSLPISKSSRETIYISTHIKNDRHCIIKQRRDLLKMDRNDHDIYQTGLIERYIDRPNENIFSNMCLAEYASFYKYMTKKSVSDEKKGSKSLPFYKEDVYDENEDIGNKI
jgi:hypothetical protein